MRQKSISLSAAALIMSFMLSQGCASTQLTVDSVAESQPATQSFYIIPGNKNVDSDDLRFREFKAYLSNALVKKGLKPTDDATKDYLVVTLAYGVGSAEKSVESYAVPVYGFGGMAGFAGYSGYGYGIHRPIPSPITAMPVGYNTVVEEEVNYTIDCVAETVARLRRMSPLWQERAVTASKTRPASTRTG